MLDNLPPSIQGEKVFLDTETTGINYMIDTPFLLAFGINNEVTTIKWSHQVVKWLINNLPKAASVIGHNIKFDIHMLIQGGFPIHLIDQIKWECTMVNAALINEHEDYYSLDALGLKYSGVGKSSEELYEKLADIFGGPANKSQMKNLSKAPIEIVRPYAEDDIRATKALYERQIELINAQDLHDIVNLEKSVIPVLVEMERRGIPIDEEALSKAGPMFKEKLQENTLEIIKLVGRDVNTNSGPQMLKAFESLKIPIPLQKNKPSFAKDLIELNPHPFIPLALTNRSLRKMQDTFVEGLKSHIYNGKVYTSFNQTKSDNFGTSTGRLSSSNPNIQQIPKRNTTLASIIRGLFIPEHKKQKWLSGDWSQFEFRIFAHYVKDEAVINQYINNPESDYHQICADLTGVPRNPYAKQINLGLVFGMGTGKLAKLLNLPYVIKMKYGKEILIPGKEAQAIFDKYHAALPNARIFLSQASEIAIERGYVKTLLGRHIRFPEGKFIHKAGGLVFQGSAADLMKKKLIELNRELSNIGAQVISVVHDEFNVLTDKGNVKKTKGIMKEIMEDIPELRVPIIANVGIGDNWWTACTE